MSFNKIQKLADKFQIKIATNTSMQPADIQDALGMNTHQGYYDQNKINSVVLDVANKFKISDATNGNITLNMHSGGKISVLTNLSNEKNKEKLISNYLNVKYAKDMTNRVIVYAKNKDLSIVNDITGIFWIKF